MTHLDGPTQQQITEILRRELEADFRFFVSYFFYHQKLLKFDFAEHHDLLIDALLDVYHGRTQNLIINIPPRFGKTELIIIMFSAWCFVKNPNCEFIHLSFSDPLVMDNSDRIRQIIKSKEFQTLWPSLKTKHTKDSKSSWGLGSSGSFLAVQSGGTVTGFGAGRLDEYDGENFRFSGCLLIDDPLKPDDARSDLARNSVNRRWDETIKTRRNSQYTPTIVIMQRLHVDDFVAMLLKDRSMEWRHIVLPAILDEGTEKERSMWPRKFNLEALKKIQSQNKHQFATQYQQAPYALGGEIIKGSWFGRYRIPPKIKYRKIFADTAMKTGERNDYSVFECWGVGEDNKLYLLDMIRGKWEAPELKRRAIDFWNKHKEDKTSQLRTMVVEDKASGTGLIQDIKRDGKIPIAGLERTKDKLTRVMDILSYIESGYVMLPEEASYVSEFISECESFTSDDSHYHDDQIDPMCDAINEMIAARDGPIIIPKQALMRAMGHNGIMQRGQRQ